MLEFFCGEHITHYRERCPACGAGFLVDHEDRITVNGRAVLLRYSVCDHCKSELADAEQSRRNKADAVNALSDNETTIESKR